MTPRTQQAIVQAPSGQAQGDGSLPLIVSCTETVPGLPPSSHVLVRVRAVALNPNDHKMVANFRVPGNGVGCDFCGVVESIGGGQDETLGIQAGARVCGPMFPYSSTTTPDESHRRMGAFAEWVIADARLLLRVPSDWSDLQGAALGGVGWSTVAMAMSHPTALALLGCPSRASSVRDAVLVYGGGTATGTMACQLLKLSGYEPIAVTQTAASTNLARRYGAASVVSGTEEPIAGATIRHVLDCITDADSAKFCFSAIARTGGRYACLEQFRESWRTRRVVKVKEVMGFEVLGYAVDLGGPQSTYTREPDTAAVTVGRQWVAEMQSLLDKGLVEPHPVQEVSGSGGWAENVLRGMALLESGKVHGAKLAVRIH